MAAASAGHAKVKARRKDALFDVRFEQHAVDTCVPPRRRTATVQSYPELVTLGLNAVDRIALLDQPPRADAKIRARAIVRRAGGQAATAAVTAARLGCRAAYIGAVGDDEDGAFALAELRREGVDCAAVRVRRGASSQRALIVSCRRNGSRSIAWHKDDAITISPAELDFRLLGRARCFLCDGHFLPAETAAARHCRTRGIPTVIDFEYGSGPAMRRLLRKISHIVAPRAAVDRLHGRRFRDDRARCDWLRREFGAECAVVTAGAGGCAGGDADGFIRVPARRVRVVDTTGAGDVFHGAYCVALLAGWPLSQRLRFANYIAGEKCRKAGAREGIPYLAALRGPLARALRAAGLRASGLSAKAGTSR